MATGRFGDPAFEIDTFVFSPTAFRAESAAKKGAATASDVIHYVVEAVPDNCFRLLTLRVDGQLSIPSAGGQVSAEIVLSVEDLEDPLAEPIARTLRLSSTRAGTRGWTLSVDLSDTDLDLSCPRRLRILSSCEITAVAQGSGVAWIDCRTGSSSVSVNGPCMADWNNSGAADVQDFYDFIDLFFIDAADFNGDGETTSQDFFDFLMAYFAGC